MNIRHLLPAGLLACLALGPTLRAASVEERLKALEDKLAALAQENATLKKQLGYDAKGKPGPAPVLAAGKEAKLSIGGYVQLNGEAGDAPDTRFPALDRFLVRRARMNFKANFAENFDFVFQSDFGNNSLAANTGYRAHITDVYATWTKYPAANLQLGQFKTPYGYEQLLPDTKVAMVERSLPNDQLTLSRQIGAQVAGSVLEKRLSYAAGLFNGLGVNNGGNDNEQFLYVGRVAGTIFDNARVKVNAGVAAFTTYDTGTFTGHRTGRAAEAQLFCGGAEVNAELFRTHFDRDVGVDYNAQGWAVLGSYFLVPNKWQALFRYESMDPNLSIGTDKTSLRTIGLNYYIKGDDLKLSLNYLVGNPPGAKQHQDRLLGRMQLIF